MTNSTDLEERLVDLETKLSMQSRTMDELSDTLRDQWDQIDKLERQVRKLNDRLLTTEGDLSTILPPDQPPPHY